jgi:hypothetical protein
LKNKRGREGDRVVMVPHLGQYGQRTRKVVQTALLRAYECKKNFISN